MNYLVDRLSRHSTLEYTSAQKFMFRIVVLASHIVSSSYEGEYEYPQYLSMVK